MPNGSSVFNDKAVQRLRNPDDVDEYIRIQSPSVTLILCACAALLLGAFVWGLFGSVSTKVATKAAVVDDQVLCFLSEEDVEKLHVGYDATLDDATLAVALVSSVPVSRGSAQAIVEDPYLLNVMMPDDWAYLVVLEGADATTLPRNVPLDASITVERVAPISLLLRG